MHIGIDLGTTYCCVAYVDAEGKARVIPSSYRQEPTTPSVIWFDGRQAYVGQPANDRKVRAGEHVHEFVKRDIGKPVERAPDDPPGVTAAPYQIGGFKYGAAGMSAIILRKLKRDAVAYLRDRGLLPADAQEKTTRLDAVITVPAYFGELERNETRLAGWAAGLNVVGIINEPTAAALAYSRVRPADARIMVFDLGGGTLDVTVLQMREDGDARVLRSVGNNQLGGRDWDAVIEQFVHEAFRRRNGRSIPDDAASSFDVQDLALRAKLELSERPQTEVRLNLADGELEETLYREAPPDAVLDLDALDLSVTDDAFHFDQRASDLLSRCQAIVESALEERLPNGERRRLAWADIDEIVLAGGSCRMPMVPAMLERVSGRRIRRHVEGFDYDTAIAIGAALYGLHRARVTDVVSHGLGVEVRSATGRPMIDYLVDKDTPLPARAQRSYGAPARARLEVYEGESPVPDEATRRGHLGLENPAGTVTITFELDTDGILRATAQYPGATPDAPSVTEVLEIHNDGFMDDARAAALREKVQALPIN